MAHALAALTPLGRRLLVQRVIEQGWSAPQLPSRWASAGRQRTRGCAVGWMKALPGCWTAPAGPGRRQRRCRLRGSLAFWAIVSEPAGDRTGWLRSRASAAPRCIGIRSGRSQPPVGPGSGDGRGHPLPARPAGRAAAHRREEVRPDPRWPRAQEARPQHRGPGRCRPRPARPAERRACSPHRDR